MLERIMKTYSKYTSKIYFLSKGFATFYYMYVNMKIENTPLQRQLIMDC